jgi:hypothetical protein
MCMDHSIVCKCGRRDASFNFKNEVMPPEAIEALYCPECSHGVSVDPGTMIRDNGWVIHYDMDVAGLYSNRLPVSEKEKLSPELLFDEGYITWRGVYPGDHIDSAREREELAKLAKEDPKRYFAQMKSWAINRMARLKEEGWRKAYEG